VDKFKDMDNAALAAFITEKRAALQALITLQTPTDEQVAEAKALAVEVREAAAEETARTEASAASAAEFEALRAEFSEAPAEEESEEEETEEPAEEESEAETTEPEQAEVKQEVTVEQASSVARLAAKGAKRPAAPARQRTSAVSLTASADVPGYSTGQSLDSLTDVAKAVINRAKGFGIPQGDGTTVSLQQFGTATFNVDFPEDLVVDRNTDVMEVMDRAVDETRLPNGSLTAAGGWCAPSETVYDLTQDATTEGMLSLPEIAVRRGGIRFALSPSFADFYANPGFKQTEAQAIAGTSKPCVEIDCPDFDEERLDAVGICIKVPILTNAGYPEVVRNFVAGTMVAHQHWVNADVIGRVQTLAGAARVFTGLGSTYSDSVEALGLVIDQTRQKYRLGMRATVEVVVPFWVKNALRADLSRRAGRPTGAVTDAEIASHFAGIGANVQYVYDWQAIDETAEVYPASFDALVYPAGTLVKGTAPVINLNTVYDAASLTVNTYTGLFMEQGLLVAHRKFHVERLTLPICNAGRTGASDITCDAGV
jgi:chemotaxis protein histidine kinase CheA